MAERFPPAIAFGTGDIDREHLLRAGVRLDLLLIVISTVVMPRAFLLVWPFVF
ncbi:hypothetical protein NDI76_20170 [Halogeometricum sp. S1BR25-6]|uniref:Uncharacterized protein n=1 Tax=Halogeometricum salsisoli TaxID=2950536 RepID=A0ABU2GLH7_9EURY|nr:hypothetical protein [Halogeometricum sp. S1BR25-6]MDS0301059.1 hypothetical protein [Halogeometricum sp. S1BR25-6]